MALDAVLLVRQQPDQKQVMVPKCDDAAQQFCRIATMMMLTMLTMLLMMVVSSSKVG
jgi:hypothetical protein